MVENVRSSVPAVTLTIIPPSRPSTPPLGFGGGDNGTDSLASPSSSNLSPLSPIFPSRRYSLSETSDDGMTSCNTSMTNLSISPSEVEEYGARTIVYHIYHAGRRQANYTIHTIKDTALAEDLRKEIGPVYLERGCGNLANSGIARRIRAAVNAAPLPKKITADDGELDPRKATYFMHTPCIWFRDPPQTLRFGGDKHVPAVCLVEGSFMWRTWRLDFVVPEDEDEKEKGKKGKKGKADDQEKPVTSRRVDSGFSEGEDQKADVTNEDQEKKWKGLNEPGVMDPRGVLASKYPLRSSHRAGETGKKYIEEQAKRRKSTPVTPSLATLSLEQVNSRIKKRSSSFSEKMPGIFRVRSASSISTITPPPTPVPELLESMLPAGPDPQDLPDHLKPSSLEEGSLLVKWTGWLTREYQFLYKGVDFRWKGTSTVNDDKKYWGSWSRYNHLKLVAIFPDLDEDDQTADAEQEKKELVVKQRQLKRRGSFSSFVSLLSRRDSDISVEEVTEKKSKKGRGVVIAKYTCLAAVRKVGRLTIFEHGLEKATRVHVKSGVESEFETEKERLKHLVVATALCMIKGEKQKRETIIKIIETLLLAPEAAA